MALRLVVLVAVACGVAVAFPSGAPNNVTVLDSMKPCHPFDPQTDPAPYTLGFEASSTGDRYALTLSGSIPYKGFLVQVRSYCGKRIGAFEVGPNYRLLGNGQAVTQNNNQLKNSTRFVWRKPADASVGIAYYTVVQLRSTFWVKLKLPLFG